MSVAAIAPIQAGSPAQTDAPALTWTPVSAGSPGNTHTPQAALVTPVDTQAPADNLPTEVPPVDAAPVQTAAPTPTFDPYELLTIDYLSTRLYGLDGFQVERVLSSNSDFTRTLISYPSDGLRIYGFMDTPRQGNLPFPVVIAVHGYVDPTIYQTLDYTTAYADALARAGFLVIHPNLRGYQPSDDGPNLFKVGMAVDVLNLISIVKAQGGKPGFLEAADPQAIGLWGHSMGGGIVLRVITVSKDVRAAVLYGAVSGDEKLNYPAVFGLSGSGSGYPEQAIPDTVMQLISPINYLNRITAAVSIHHGEADSRVPMTWSAELYGGLQALKKQAEFFIYPNEGHIFDGVGNDLFEVRVITFFERYLTK
jgi:dipeptidyl aminopeptidase/acylaminoacyl peptidase